ncbi:transposase [Gilvimarinus algae]|uniref:Transposase n=1 Tax=Gilvimarinus algae TaxID=3058037 RepID=A0ABT8TAZ8_9GAMM|nr:transposase [Gilvimarinus sp. SDUM040014]MDO3380754.1 transposase [Gilvimarinus sp. SDUM040014]
MKTFFKEEDYLIYLELVAEHKAEAGVEIWAYCLMPNHVHFVAVPNERDNLSGLFRSVHRHYSRAINFRQKCTGHLWQERFHSFMTDEQYLLATAKYVELNPVKANLFDSPEQWLWSRARIYLARRDDAVVTASPKLY